MAKQLRCYYCSKPLKEEEMVIKPFPLATKRGTRMYKRKFHYDCVPKYIKANGNVESKQAENSDWDKVYKYFQKDILGLSDGAQLSPHATERLLGLRVGRYKPNASNTRVLKSGYSFATILYTMKYSKRSIDRALNTVEFKDDQHRVDYLMKIIQNNINFIQTRMDKLAEQEKRAEKLKKEEATEEQRGVQYKRKGTGRRKVELI